MQGQFRKDGWLVAPRRQTLVRPRRCLLLWCFTRIYPRSPVERYTQLVMIKQTKKEFPRGDHMGPDASAHLLCTTSVMRHDVIISHIHVWCPTHTLPPTSTPTHALMTAACFRQASTRPADLLLAVPVHNLRPQRAWLTSQQAQHLHWARDPRAGQHHGRIRTPRLDQGEGRCGESDRRGSA